VSKCLDCESDQQQVGRDDSVSRPAGCEHRYAVIVEPHNDEGELRRMGEAVVEVGQVRT